MHHKAETFFALKAHRKIHMNFREFLDIEITYVAKTINTQNQWHILI